MKQHYSSLKLEFSINSYFKYFSILVFFLVASMGYGQTIIVPAANTDNGSVNDPYGTFYGYERSAMIYTAAQIGTTGSITDVGFYLNSLPFDPSPLPFPVAFVSTIISKLFPV